MRICFLHAGFSLHGGIERVLSIIIRNLSMRKDVEIFCLSLNESAPLDLYSLPTALKTNYLFEEPINMKNAFMKGGVKRLVKYLKVNQIDIIIACGVIYFPLACIGAKLAGVKVISWEHTNPACKNEFVFEGISRSIGARFSNMNVLISQEARRYYEINFRRKRNRVIYNPVDGRLFEKGDPYRVDSKKLISVGRLTYQKNYHLLVDIAEKLLTRHDDWVWHIFGDGEQRAELEARIAEKGLEGKLELMGTVSDLYDRYPEYAALVMTSRYEGFPMVLIEASAKGLPMISFDIPTGPKEIIKDHTNGFLIPEGDVDGMIEKLELLITDKELRSRLSIEAKRRVEAFNVESITNQWCELFGEMTES